MTEDRIQNTEYRRKTRDARRRAMTLIEIIVSLAIMVVIFAVIVPQFAIMRNNWNSQQAAAETLQNGRILTDHLNRNLSKAVKITAVSDSSTANGYIQFQDNDGNNLRYEIVSSYVQFGVVDSLSDLAGPVSQLQFSCYDACDLDSPLSSPIDVNSIRLVKAETTLTNSSGPDKTLSAAAYLRVGVDTTTWNITKGTIFEFDALTGTKPDLAKIDTTHYLCAYVGKGGDGWAVVLTVDTDNLTISKGTSFEFDTIQGMDPALIQIDATHYLCAYKGPGDDGWAVVLTVDTANWTITRGTPYRFETDKAQQPALAKIDDTHYLCAYSISSADGRAVVLTVNTGDWTITRETPYQYDAATAVQPALTKIDDTHYLCAYSVALTGGWAAVLTVDTGNWTITKETPLRYCSSTADNPALAQIDSGHYLCVYDGASTQGCAVVLTVDTELWTVSAGSQFVYESVFAVTPALAEIDTTHWLCAYQGHVNVQADNGWLVVLTVSTDDWTITKEEGTLFEWEPDDGATPVLAKIDDTRFVCGYEGPFSDGWSVALFVDPTFGLRP